MQIPAQQENNPEVIGLNKQREALEAQVRGQDDLIKLAEDSQKNLEAWLEALKNTKNNLPDGDITSWDKNIDNIEGSYKTSVTLQPQETKKYHYQIFVKYPNDKRINW